MKANAPISRALLGIAVAALLAAPAIAQDDEFSWSGRIPSGQAIEIKNANGRLYAEYAPGDQVEVTAIKEGPAGDRAEVEIEVVEHDGGVTICAVYPGGWLRSNECAPGDEGHIGSNDNDTEVTFTIKVPADVKLVATTMNGRIEVEDLRSDAEVLTMNGRIEISTTGWAHAKTMNGAITATLGAADWSGDLELQTMNGGVTVTLPANANTDVNAATMNGEVESDWTLERSGWIRSKARGTIGDGGRGLDISTMNGNIRIRRGS